MQFSSLDVKDTSKLIGTIEWINKNTEPGAIIAGEKHWRGFMELYLRDGRTYISLSYSELMNFGQNAKNAAYVQGNQRITYLIFHDTSTYGPFVVHKVGTQQGSTQ